MKTNAPVVAIGLDSADPIILETWMNEGKLKNLAAIRDAGVYGRLNNKVNYLTAQGIKFSCTEPLWVMCLTGCLPNKTGFWDTVTYSHDYSVRCDAVYGGYDYGEYKPFYSLFVDHKVLAFDIPVSRVVDNVNGVQVTGWGGHHPFVASESQPADVLPSIVERYGENPVFRKDNGSWWSQDYFNWVTTSVEQSLTTRTQILSELMAKDDWDLFFTAFGETHTLGHDLLHLSQPQHPLYSALNKQATLGDPMLKGFQQVDEAVGKLLQQVPEDAYVVVFSLHGMDVNNADLLSMMFIAEVMYRFNFPGKYGLTPGNIDEPPGPVILKNIRNGWAGEVWRQVYEPNPLKKLWNTWAPKRFLADEHHGLKSPYSLYKDDLELGWMPAMSYSGLWPKMKAFAIPGFADGYVRINLKGRERDGIVDPAEYDSLCEEITKVFYGLKDGRTGKALVQQVIRTRLDPFSEARESPEADLIIVWDDLHTDVVDSPDVGRIGPITYNRSGGHRARGFMMVKGPGLDTEYGVTEGGAVDVGATILSLLGEAVPAYFDGKPLVKVSIPSAV